MKDRDAKNIFNKFLITIISWQLSVFNPLFAGDLTDDDNLTAQKEACTGSSVEWNSSLNSCVTTVAAEEAQENSSACASSSNPDECYLSNAEGLSGVEAESDYESSNLEMVGKVIAGAYAAFGFIAGLSGADGVAGRIENKSPPVCMSGRLFQYTSVGWIAGDLFLKYSAKKNFEKLAEEYKDEAENDELKGSEAGSYQAQVRAFEYLKSEQEDVKKQADKRKLLQFAVVAGYTASMGFAIAELWGSSTPCGKNAKKAEPTPAPTPTTPVKPNTAGTTNTNGSSSIMQNVAAKFGPLKDLVGTSKGNLVASGIMLGLNGYLIYHAMNEKSKAEKNIAAIDKVLETYSEYMAGFCPDGRDDVSDPSCYCYNSDGSQNSKRTNSVICQNLFASKNVNYAAQTAKEETTGARQGCVTVTGQFDVDCKCANMKNSAGQNACATVTSLSTNTSGFTSALDVPDAIATANKFTNGASAALASLDSASLSKSAAKNKRLTDKLLGQAKKNKLDVPSPSNLESMVSDRLKAIASSMPASSTLSSFSGIPKSNSASRPSGVDKALEKAKESEVSAAAGALLSSLSNGSGAIGSNVKENNFVWNDSASGSGNANVQTFMDKEYKYKNSDIVNRKDVSLWNVISNRYQTSGVKRLFEDAEDSE